VRSAADSFLSLSMQDTRCSALITRRQILKKTMPAMAATLVVRGERATVKQILGYSVALLAVTIVPYATGSFGSVYLVAALGLGGVLVALAVRLRRGTAAPAAAALFRYSLLHSTALAT
jgi:heme o synthase